MYDLSVLRCEVKAFDDHVLTLACFPSFICQVAWLFNIRGSDISFNPVAFAGALLTQDNAFLFIDAHKFEEGVDQVKTTTLCAAAAPEAAPAPASFLKLPAWSQVYVAAAAFSLHPCSKSPTYWLPNEVKKIKRLCVFCFPLLRFLGCLYSF